MPEATWNGKAWVTDDGRVVSTDPNAGMPVASHAPESGVEDALPALMGTGASMLAGGKAWPGGMAAAGAGGAAGELLRQGIIRARKNVEPSTGERVMGGLQAALGPVGILSGNPEAAAAGVAQAGLEGVGRAAGTVATTAAKQLYQTALRPAMHLAREYGMKNLVNEGFANKVWPNTWGVPKAQKLMREGAEEVTKVADAADAAQGGIATLSTSRAMQERVPRVLRQAMRRSTDAGTEDMTPAIMDRAQRVLQANPGLQTNRQMLDAKRVSDEVAREAYDAARATQSPVPPGSEGAFAKAMSEGRNVLLRDSMGPAYKQANKVAQRRYGLMRATEDASNRPNELANQMTLMGAGAGAGLAADQSATGGIQGALVGRALMSPTVRTGIAFATPGLMRLGVSGANIAGGGESLRDALLDLMSRNTEIP